MTLRTLGILVLATALGACGWRAGLPTPEGSSSLAVAFPGNDSRLRDLELEFGLALSEAALERLDLLPAAPGDADLVIHGRVVDFRGRGGIRSPDNELLEAGVDLRLAVELLDRRSGEVLGRAERSLEGGFLVDPVTSPFRTPDAIPARARVIRNLAEGLLLDLFAPPSYEDLDSETEPLEAPAGTSATDESATTDGS